MKKKLIILLFTLIAIAAIISIVDNKKDNKYFSGSDVDLLLTKVRGSQIYMPCSNCDEPNYEQAVSIGNIMELRVVLNKMIGAEKSDISDIGLGLNPLKVNIEYDGEYDLEVLFIDENTVAINHDREVFTVYELKENSSIKTSITNLYNSYKK